MICRSPRNPGILVVVGTRSAKFGPDMSLFRPDMSWFRSLALDWGCQHANRVPMEKRTGWPGSVPGNIVNMDSFQAAMYLQGWVYVASSMILKNQNQFCFSTCSFYRCSTGHCWVSCTFLWDIWCWSQWTRLAQQWVLICCKSTTTTESAWEGGGSCPGLSLEFASFFVAGEMVLLQMSSLPVMWNIVA